MRLAAVRRAHTRTAFTLVELVVVVIVLGILASIAVASFTEPQRRSSDADSKRAVIAHLAAQDLNFTSRGAFVSWCPTPTCTSADSPADLLSLEPSYSYVAPGSASVRPTQLSVAVCTSGAACPALSAGDLPAVVVASMSTSGRCFYAVHYHPQTSRADTKRMLTAGSCSASTALGLPAGATW